MNNIYILIFMICCHIADDYYLQRVGALAFMKQKNWWTENAPDAKYKYDYIVALTMHAFSWSSMIHLPVMISTKFATWIIPSILINTIIHAVVDDLKANKFKMNLIQDQVIHIIQIVVVFVLSVLIKI